MAEIIISLLILLLNFCFISEAGVTEIPLDTSDDEAVVETVADDAWMPSNIFDVSLVRSVKQPEFSAPPKEESPWSAESIPIFQAIRDFIFQTDEELIPMEEESDNDPTEEIVKIIEKGLMEATTLFLTPSDDEHLTVSSTDLEADPISVVKIENDVNNPMLDRIGINVLEPPNKRLNAVNLANTTTACSGCYNKLENCVQQCFRDHNCHDVQRQARTCPLTEARICNIFTQWAPEDECKSHEDCKSPLLCCNDGCVNKCSPGEWRN